ncbi:Fibronectin domain-containing protein [Oryctes borbonicus]|uniref:Fibronectin domain-containing protein n=1 Tax=Oryctes borbonicus TaxID=1629725 RepID=A0A0T6AY31_9SCAR|nr:Fibronectin domain-containing protein [Oryctes borbonicus]
MAYGYPIPSYNWTRLDAPMPRNVKFESYNRVLSIPNVKVEDQGEYMCTIFNEKAARQKSVKLNVQAEPNFTIPLTDKHVDIRSELIWVCEAFGIPEVNYTWWRNGRQLVMGYLEPEDYGRIIIQDNVLKIERVEDRDAGMYQCRASNTLKAKYSSAQLRILAFRPSFKKQPLEIETYAAEGGNVTINCNPEAAPKPQYIWKKEGHVIDSGGPRRIFSNGSLYIRQVSRDDAGFYTCAATNELGFDESTGRLVVLRGPNFIEMLRPRIVTAIGRHFELRCEASIDQYALLDIAYIWKHNGIPIEDADIFNFESRVKIIGGGYLVVLNTTFSDAGEYECLVKSAVGDISSKSIVIVQGPPGPPGGLTINSLNISNLVLTWTDGASHGRPILSHTIFGRTNWNMTWRNLTEGVQAVEIDRFTNRKRADVYIPLTPWSTYEFKVAAWNELGMSELSPSSPRQSTPAMPPYKAPSNVGGGGGKKGDLTITWTPLRSDEQNGPGIYYKIFFKQKDQDSEYQHLIMKRKGNTGKAVIHVKPEYYYRKYIVRVQSINSLGEGPIGNEVIIYSAEDIPLATPQKVLSEPYNSTALNVSWRAVDESLDVMRGKLLGHRIKYWRDAKGITEDDSVYYLSRSTKPWALIVGLQPDTYYFVKVMVYNGAGEGEQSAPYRRIEFLKQDFSILTFKFFRTYLQESPTKCSAFSNCDSSRSFNSPC